MSYPLHPEKATNSSTESLYQDKIAYITLHIIYAQEIQEDRITLFNTSMNHKHEENKMSTMYDRAVVWPASSKMIIGDAKASREEAMSGLRDSIERYMAQWVQQA